MAISIELYEIFKGKIGETEAKKLAHEWELWENAMEAKLEKKWTESQNKAATKSDIHSLELKIQEQEVRLSRTIYITSLVQLLAIIGSILAIVKFLV